jgi:predicted PurR-regulated permease PerM
MSKGVPFITQGLLSGISTAANITTVLLIVPFILFYLLKDDKLFSRQLLSIVPEKHKDQSMEILSDVDKSLSAYIIGQTLIAITSGTLMYIGYIIFGLNYSLILALFVMLTSFIPIIGAFIGIVPAILVGLTSNDPYIIIKLVILMFVVQQLEGNLISPQIIGKRMNIHPLTFIILLIAAASLYGFVGMLIAVPTYAVAKVLIKNIYELYKLRKE